MVALAWSKAVDSGGERRARLVLGGVDGKLAGRNVLGGVLRVYRRGDHFFFSLGDKAGSGGDLVRGISD